jgi:transposase InsO family protein
MNIRLHKNATTTPARRAYIQSSPLSVAALAAELGVSEDTIRRWKGRDTVEDGSHTAHHLQTTLSPAQEAVVIELRKMLWLPLDDLLAVTREFIHEQATRSGLHRLLQRHGLSRLPAEPKPEATPKPFKAYEPGYLHMDVKYLPQMADEDARRYLFVAIDRATRWVFIQLYPDKSAASAERFLTALHQSCPIRITRLLTDNGKEFTDRLFGGSERQPTGEHQFDQLCQALGIEHRLTQPKHPQTNGMVERFNGRIADILKTHRFVSGQDLETTLTRYVWLYNHHLPQKALGHRAPMQAMKQWYADKPELFNKSPRNRPGPDT